MKTIRSQMMGLFLLLMTAMVALVVVWNGWEQGRAARLADAAFKDKKQFVNRVVDLKGSSTANLDDDYTYWDELVGFVNRPDKKWAAQNLDQALSTYKVTVCWVFDPSGKLVYRAISDAKQHDIDIPFTPTRLAGLFRTERRKHFFLRTPHGTLEIRGATIHKTADAQRIGPWYGYFLVGKLWDKDYQKELSDLTNCQVMMSEPGSTDHPGVQQDGTYECALDLLGVDGKQIAIVRFTGVLRSIQAFRQSTRAGVFLVLVCIVLISAIVLANLHQRVSVPLARLSRSLETGDTTNIAGLEHNPTEFGGIARLISNYFVQRSDLVEEVKERMQAEGALRDAHRVLEDRVRERTSELEAAYVALQAEYEERKQAQEELSRAEAQLIQSAKLAALGTLSAGVAHELNQPVAVIRGLTQQMLAEEELDAHTRDDLKMIEGQTTRMMKIVNHLRTFSRATGGEFQTVDLNQVIAGCIVIVGQQLRTHNVEVYLNVRGEPLWVSGDANELEQVVFNLITNARHAMEGRADARVTIATWSEGAKAVLELRDNGPGITDKAVSRLFDPFFTTKDPGKGTGLGLSISHTIIQKHGGTIQAHNDNGAVFRIEIPALAADSNDPYSNRRAAA